MNRHRASGFSLIELLVYIAIIAVFSSILASVFIALARSRGQLEARAEVNQALRFASEKLVQDIRAASSVTTPATAGANSSTLTLMVNGSTITYRMTSGILERQVGVSSAEPITPSTVSVGTLLFTRTENTNAILGKTRIGIRQNLTVSYQTSSTDWSYTASKTNTTLLRDE